MKVVGLITEYNPFHNGHKYHLEKSKEISKSDYSICVMSGNFLQRGEPALVDKWTRAKMAIDNGVDLVIELPTIYACQSAEYFALGSILLLNSLGIIDSIVFGSEVGEIEKLKLIANVLANEPNDFKNSIKKHLSTGLVFPKARSFALIEYFNKKDVYIDNLSNIISNPNNILGIEYLKSLIKINSRIEPHTIKRIISNYNDDFLTGNISSATAIRKSIFDDGIYSANEALPKQTLIHLENFMQKYKSFNSLENFNQLLMYLLRVKNSSLSKIFDIENGLDNRITSCSDKSNNILETLECIKTKRYTFTRIQRILIHLLLDITEDKFLKMINVGPQYIRILGSNQKGLSLLSEIKTKSTIPIITKFSSYKKFNNELLNEMIYLDKIATDIYFLGLNQNIDVSNLDYITTPYIKKE